MISKLKNKSHGFTLIEVLAVVVILSIVSFVGFNVFNSLINKTDENALAVSLNNVKKAAELYSNESGVGSWNRVTTDDGVYLYSCVTISELMNRGYFKDDLLDNSINKKNSTKVTNDSYVKVVKDTSNMTIVDTKIINDNKITCENDAIEHITVNDDIYHTITYETNGGSYCPPDVVKDGLSVNLCNTKRDMYSFAGWYTRSKDGSKVADANDVYSPTHDIVLYAHWVNNPTVDRIVNVRYNVNGGRLASVHGSSIGIKDNFITFNNSLIVQSFVYDTDTGSSGLMNWNNPNYINLVRSDNNINYTVKYGAEWCLDPAGESTCFDQGKVYNSSSLCDASSNSCTVDLYANWVPNNDVYYPDPCECYDEDGGDDDNSKDAYDVIIMVDSTLSMNSDNKVNSVNRIVKDIVSVLKNSNTNSYLSIYTYNNPDDGNCSKNSKKSGVISSYEGSVDGNINFKLTTDDACGQTNIQYALYYAYNKFLNSSRKSTHKPILYFITDGYPTAGYVGARIADIGTTDQHGMQSGSSVVAYWTANTVVDFKNSLPDAKLVTIGVGLDPTDEYARFILNPTISNYNNLNKSDDKLYSTESITLFNLIKGETVYNSVFRRLNYPELGVFRVTQVNGASAKYAIPLARWDKFYIRYNGVSQDNNYVFNDTVSNSPPRGSRSTSSTHSIISYTFSKNVVTYSLSGKGSRIIGNSFGGVDSTNYADASIIGDFEGVERNISYIVRQSLACKN